MQIGDATMHVRDLSIGELTRIAKARNLTYRDLLYRPLYDLGAAAELVTLCAASLGVEPPQPTARAISQALVLTDDDLPEMLENGVPSVGGRDEDGWLAVLCRPPWNFTARQIREEFTVRDLQLMVFVAEAH